MRILDATIADARMITTSKGTEFAVIFKPSSQNESTNYLHYFKPENLADTHQMMKLEEYAESKNFNDLNGKEVRILVEDVQSTDGEQFSQLLAFGHALENTFLSLNVNDVGRIQESGFGKYLEDIPQNIKKDLTLTEDDLSFADNTEEMKNALNYSYQLKII